MSEPASDASSVCIALPDRLCIGEAQAFKQQLLVHVDDAAPVELDGSSVTDVDTTALQLLAAFFRDRRGHGHATRWLKVSGTLGQVARLLGLHPWLELPNPI